MRILVAFIGCWTGMVATAMAQVPEQETKSKSYIPVYLLIVLAVGGALTLVCRSSRRLAEVKQHE